MTTSRKVVDGFRKSLAKRTYSLESAESFGIFIVAVACVEVGEYKHVGVSRNGRTGCFARSYFGNYRRVELKFAVRNVFGAYLVEFFHRRHHLIDVGVFSRTLGRVGYERYFRSDSRNRNRALCRRLSDISELLARGALIKSRIGVDIATVFAVFIAALGGNHKEIRRNDGRSLSRFDNLKSGAKSVRRRVTRSRDHSVNVARFKHQRSVHGVVFRKRFSREFGSHTLFLTKFVKKVCVFFRFGISLRVDDSYARKVYVGIVFLDFVGVSEKSYSRNALFYRNRGGLYHPLIFPLGKNDMFVEFYGSLLNAVEYF